MALYDVKPNPVGRQQPAPTNPLVNQYKLYDTAVGQQAGDYSGLMNAYRDYLSKVNSQQPLTAGRYTPQTYDYKPTDEYTRSISNLEHQAQTGGYEPGEIADLRERGISPIRSVYANANRDVDRQRALQGGFSPNYNATKAKLARELSDKIAGQVTNVNAGIAENVARGRLSMAPALSGATGEESALRNQYGARNAETQNEAQRFNLTLPLQYGQYNQGQNDQTLRALEGMRGLYGTTPALSALFGSQALNASQLQNQINQGNNQGQLQYISQLISGLS